MIMNKKFFLSSFGKQKVAVVTVCYLELKNIYSILS